MNYLIFGGEGFIGRHLVNYLVRQKNIDPKNIYSFDLVRKTAFENYHFLDVRKPIELDIENLTESIIFNLAAIHTTPGHPDYEYFETNIRGAENICSFAERHKIRQIVFTSSIAPYGAGEDNKSEHTLPTPNTPYGISKLVAEHIFRTWLAAEAPTRKLVIVRPGVVFGKEEGGNFTRLYKAQKKGFFFYPGRKDTLKACVYVKDVARILFDSITDASSENFKLYNLTYYPAPTIEEICTVISSETGASKPLLLVPSWLLKTAASIIYHIGGLVGLKFSGIHPDRVKKLMVSTNINGSKLQESPYALRYSLPAAIQDWKLDSANGGLE
jgi:nucleoside-diphosphate-sugar epimerase